MTLCKLCSFWHMTHLTSSLQVSCLLQSIDTQSVLWGSSTHRPTSTAQNRPIVKSSSNMSILKTLVKVHAHCRLVSWVLGSYLKYEICIFSTSHNCVLEHFHKNHVQCGFCLRLTEWIQEDHFELWLRIDEKTSFMQCKE